MFNVILGEDPTGAGGHKTPRPTAAALAVVVRNEQVILACRANPPDAGLWGFPGGKIEFGETIEAAAVRELWEETRVTAEAVTVFTAVGAIDLNAGRIAHHYVLIAVLCRWVSGEPLAGDDALDCRWFDRQTLLKRQDGEELCGGHGRGKSLCARRNGIVAPWPAKVPLFRTFCPLLVPTRVEAPGYKLT